MCNCFDEYLEKVKEHTEKRIPNNATEVDHCWDNAVFILANGDFPSVSPKVNYSFRAVKKNGEPAKNITKNEVSVRAEYCCFCGRKYKGADKN